MKSTKRRLARRRLHLGVGANTVQIMASALTSKEVDGGVLAAGPLLEEVTG
jgi:hypothetical protein